MAKISENLTLFLRTYIGGHYRLYSPYSKFKKLGHRLVARDTDIVIEGVPRSANSFSFQAFKKAQPEGVKIAHHLHVSCQIIQAVKWNLPVILLIRHPVDAVASWILRQPNVSARRCMVYYFKYYKSLKKYAGKVVVAPFEMVVSDFGRVIEAVNGKYGRNFGLFNHTADAQNDIFRERHEYNEQLGRSTMASPAPLPEKEELKKGIKPDLEKMMVTQRAIDVYHFFMSHSSLAKDKV